MSSHQFQRSDNNQYQQRNQLSNQQQNNIKPLYNNTSISNTSFPIDKMNQKQNESLITDIGMSDDDIDQTTPHAVVYETNPPFIPPNISHSNSQLYSQSINSHLPTNHFSQPSNIFPYPPAPNSSIFPSTHSSSTSIPTSIPLPTNLPNSSSSLTSTSFEHPTSTSTFYNHIPQSDDLVYINSNQFQTKNSNSREQYPLHQSQSNQRQLDHSSIVPFNWPITIHSSEEQDKKQREESIYNSLLSPSLQHLSDLGDSDLVNTDDIRTRFYLLKRHSAFIKSLQDIVNQGHCNQNSNLFARWILSIPIDAQLRLLQQIDRANSKNKNRCNYNSNNTVDTSANSPLSDIDLTNFFSNIDKDTFQSLSTSLQQNYPIYLDSTLAKQFLNSKLATEGSDFSNNSNNNSPLLLEYHPPVTTPSKQTEFSVPLQSFKPTKRSFSEVFGSEDSQTLAKQLKLDSDIFSNLNADSLVTMPFSVNNFTPNQAMFQGSNTANQMSTEFPNQPFSAIRRGRDTCHDQQLQNVMGSNMSDMSNMSNMQDMTQMSQMSQMSQLTDAEGKKRRTDTDEGVLMIHNNNPVVNLFPTNKGSNIPHQAVYKPVLSQSSRNFLAHPNSSVSRE